MRENTKCSANLLRSLPRRFIQVLMALFLLLPAARAQENSQADDPEEQRAKLAFLNIFPFYFTDTDGNPTGFYYELAQMVFKDLGLANTSVAMPIGRVFRELSAGNQDMTVSYNMGALVPGIVSFGTIGCQQIMLIPLKTAHMKSLEEISGKRVVFPLGGYFDKRFSDRTDFTAIAVSTTRSIFQLAARGRVDAVIFNNMAFQSYATLGPSRLEAPRETLKLFSAPILLGPIEVSFSISRNSDYYHWIPVIENYLTEARASGKIATLFKKYGEDTGGDCAVIRAHLKK